MLSRERIEAILNEVVTYTITLAPDPTVLGPKYLQEQIATCRNHLNHTARIMNEVLKATMAVDHELRAKETAFQIQSDELLANNSQVRALPNIADRQSQIKLLLRDPHRELEQLRNDLKDLGHVEKIVKTIHRELKDSMGEIKLQRSMIRDEYETGRMYGDERPSVSNVPQMAGDSLFETIDDAEINSLLSGEKSLDDITPKEVMANLEVDPTVEAEQVRNFLNLGLTEEPKIIPTSPILSEQDYSDLFNI